MGMARLGHLPLVDDWRAKPDNELARRYHRWCVQRDWLYHRENQGKRVEFGLSDDDAVNLMHDMAYELFGGKDG